MNDIKKIVMTVVGLSFGCGLRAAQEAPSMATFSALREDIDNLHAELIRAGVLPLQEDADARPALLLFNSSNQRVNASGTVRNSDIRAAQNAMSVLTTLRNAVRGQLLQRINRAYDRLALHSRTLKGTTLIVPEEKAAMVRRLKEAEDVLVKVLNKKQLTNADAQEAEDIVSQIRLDLKGFYFGMAKRRRDGRRLAQEMYAESLRVEQAWQQEQARRQQQQEQEEEQDRKEAGVRFVQEKEQRKQLYKREYKSQRQAWERQAAAQRRAAEQDYSSESLDELGRSIRGVGERIQEETKRAIAQGESAGRIEDELAALLGGLPEDVAHIVGQGMAVGWLNPQAEIDSQRLTDLELSVRPGVISPDGKFITTGSIDGRVRIWNVHTRALVHELVGHKDDVDLDDVDLDEVDLVVYSPNGQFVATGSGDGKVGIWNVATGVLIGTFAEHLGPINSVAYSPDGQFIVTSSERDRRSLVWNAATRKLVHTLRHTGYVNSAAYSPDGKYIVTSSSGSRLRIWNAQTGVLVRELIGHAGDVKSAVYSRDGQFIVSSSLDKTARIWNAATGELVHTLDGHAEGVESAVYSPDRRFVVTSSEDGTAQIWDAATGTLLHSLVGHEGVINSVAISPDSSFIVTGSYDETVRIWDAQTGIVVHILRGHEGSVISVAISPDATFIVTTETFAGGARIWRYQP